MVTEKNTGIIITSLGNKNFLNKCLLSIFNQSKIPTQVIIVLPNNVKYFSHFKKVKIYNSRIKNQVHQRNLGISKLSKSTKIILQLDDRVILERNCIEQLISCWNKNKNIGGIGLNQVVSKSQPNFDGSIISNILKNYQGRVLINGLNIGYQNFKKTSEVSWLKGGLASYNIKQIKKIKRRHFPIVSWSVCEDLIFSYDLQKKKTLLVCANAKAKLTEKSKRKISLKNNYEFGKLYSHNFKYFIRKNKNLSFSLFILTILILFIYGISIGLLNFNVRKISYSFGLIIGLFSKNLFNS